MRGKEQRQVVFLRECVQAFELALFEFGAEFRCVRVPDEVPASDHARTRSKGRDLVLEVLGHVVERERAREAVRIARDARVDIGLGRENQSGIDADAIDRLPSYLDVNQRLYFVAEGIFEWQRWSRLMDLCIHNFHRYRSPGVRDVRPVLQRLCGGAVYWS